MLDARELPFPLTLTNETHTFRHTFSSIIETSRASSKLTNCFSFRSVSSHPPQLVLDKESFTLEELLEEDDVIQECKSLNSRLVNLCVFLPRVRSSRETSVNPTHFPLQNVDAFFGILLFAL